MYNDLSPYVYRNILTFDGVRYKNIWWTFNNDSVNKLLSFATKDNIDAAGGYVMVRLFVWFKSETFYETVFD